MSKRIKIVINTFICLSILILNIFCIKTLTVYADDVGGVSGGGYYVPTGGGSGCNTGTWQDGSGVAHSSDTSSVNCCSLYHERCNRWIASSIDVFKKAYAGRKGSGYSNDAYQICTDPNRNRSNLVIFAGQIKSISTGGPTLWNLYPKPDYLGYNYKLERIAFDYDNYSFVNLDKKTYLNNRGQEITYAGLIDLGSLMVAGGEEALAFVCPGMLPEEQCDPATDCCPGEPCYDTGCICPCDPATDCCPGEECYETGCVCYCGEDTSVTVKQKNSSSKIPSYSSWTVNKIYAKPTDKINYAYTYCAGVQSQAFDTVTTKHGSEGCENTSNTNKDFSEAITWNNYYKVSAPHSYSKTFTYNVGDVTDDSSSHSFNVEGSDVGKVLDSTITSSTPISASSNNEGIHKWEKVCSTGCPCGNGDPETGEGDTMNCCEPEKFEHTNNYYSKSYTSGPDSESVDVRIPYNYQIGNGKVNIKTDIFFAGETFTLTDAKIDVMTAYSETLKETYATKTQSAKISLYSYYVTPSGSKSSAVLMDSKDVSSMNSSSNLKGSTETFFSGKTYSIYDIPAGSNMCLYLVSSIGKSSNNPDSNAADGTYTSPTVCKVIYKKPSFQIWGGSLYTGSSNLKTAYKTNVSGYYSYEPNNTDKNTTFGSWVEYAVVYGKDQGSAAATGIASGASSSYSKDSKKPGGSLEPTSAKYCKRAPLTISNISCASDKITKSGIATSSSVLNSIYGLFIDGHSLKATSNNANLSNTSTYNEDKHVRYTSATNNTNISASGSLPVGITHVVYSNGTINITSNLTYENTPLTSISQIPQYIIYAKHINISCSVTRIDGWVIAKDGTIKTCSDGGDDNSSARSKQLIINGPVIAKSVVFGRTYGAASGKNSVVPAEIFNMTPMTNLWSEAGASNTPTLHSQYIRELAPRY